MKKLTKDERQAVARRIFEALCTRYPDCYVALVEQPGMPGAARQSADEIADLRTAPDSLG
jgi:hypothetical protein